MSTPNKATAPASTTAPTGEHHHLRFHAGSVHLAPAFGGDWFGVRAERFARFFGTPTFLIAQSLLVLVWIVLNAAGVVAFDLYPFILLNLAFSLQAAYAAPLINRNTELTELTHKLSLQIDGLTREIHEQVTARGAQPGTPR